MKATIIMRSNGSFSLSCLGLDRQLCADIDALLEDAGVDIDRKKESANKARDSFYEN